MRGERRPEERAEGYRRLERARGTFHRRFSLPDSADPESITASSRHGVVEISIAKRRAPKPRRIQVGS
jgi:HSP20 family protein